MEVSFAVLDPPARAGLHERAPFLAISYDDFFGKRIGKVTGMSSTGVRSAAEAHLIADPEIASLPHQVWVLDLIERNRPRHSEHVTSSSSLYTLSFAGPLSSAPCWAQPQELHQTLPRRRQCGNVKETPTHLAKGQ